MSGTPHYISTSAQCVFTGLISKQILLLQYLRKAVNMINRFSKNLYVKLLKLYYKEMSTIKSERNKTFEETGGVFDDKKSGHK